ncbi:hypothetical protein MY3296_002568 [Beauveria thailandica]
MALMAYMTPNPKEKQAVAVDVLKVLRISPEIHTKTFNVGDAVIADDPAVIQRFGERTSKLDMPT